MNRAIFSTLLATLALAITASAAEPTAGGSAFEREVRPLIAEYCLDCHSTAKHKGDLDLEQFTTVDLARRRPKVWQSALDQLNNGEMPPKDKLQPSDEEREKLVQHLTELLHEVALARAGDPGPVVLRRLSNAEYTYTLRDLTGVESLDPARQFPIDGAAGEGFMNTGNSLVMSPALLEKYLDAARGIAARAVLLPDGFRFSPSVSRRDWTDDIVSRIRGFYRAYTDPRGSTKVNLQGLVWETNEGGRLPLAKYLLASVSLRDAAAGSATVESVAREHGLSAKYLGRLQALLLDRTPSPVLDPLRARWRAARPEEIPALVAEIERWQQALWKFSSVGHIGKVGGPKAWMEPVVPILERRELRVRMPASTNVSEVRLRLAAGDAGDGADGDLVVWDRARWVAQGRPDLALRDVRAVAAERLARREALASTVVPCLAACADIEALAESGTVPDSQRVAAIARQSGAERRLLEAWLNHLGLGLSGPAQIVGHFTNHVSKVGGFEFVNGWGSPETPSIVANASDRAVRVPGNLKAHGVALHPSPTLQAAVGWSSPVTAALRIEGQVVHAHPECGNGVTWTLELRRGASRQRLAAGISQGGKPVPFGPIEKLSVRTGDVVALLIGPRDGNHACDLTGVELDLSTTNVATGASLQWNLGADVSADLASANPHPDRHGNAAVWHFFTEPDALRLDSGEEPPAGSLLARWRGTRDVAERTALAVQLQRLLLAVPDPSAKGPDIDLRRQLLSLGGPLLRRFPAPGEPMSGRPEAEDAWGLDSARFGRASDGGALEPTSLAMRAPGSVEVRVPSDLVEGYEFVVEGTLERGAGAEGSVQLAVVLDGTEPAASGVTAGLTATVPVIARDGSAARRRIEAVFEGFREVFPAALAYTKIVPVDEVVTLTLFHREDEALRRLMLDETQSAVLDRLWDELRFVSQDALTLVDAYAQLMEYATQDADPSVFEPMRRPIEERARAFRQQQVEAGPRHVNGLVRFAGEAYRRPLTDAEATELRRFYAGLRVQGIPHEEAFRVTLSRILVAPAFLYRTEKPVAGGDAAAVSDWELASRLSYFLWSSKPDDELLQRAAAGTLHQDAVLAGQVRRMLRDPRVRRLAIEFGCQWLHVHGFDELDEKSERHFPTFVGLRSAMYEETIRYFTDFFANDGTVSGLLEGDHVFVNEDMARHYGIPGVTGAEWRRVDGARKYGRGGILGLGTTLAKQSGASRTSPILRGNWVSEVLLGEPLPKPPKGVPRLPEDETATEGLTVRQLVEKHSSDPKCSGCHSRIDPYGFALEAFDAIGGRREKDLGGRPIDTRSKTADGSAFDGIEGLQSYLLGKRGEAFRRQFCRKLLGYALGRSTQISDQPLLEAMRQRLADQGEHVGGVVEEIVLSRQFRRIRGRDAVSED